MFMALKDIASKEAEAAGKVPKTPEADVRRLLKAQDAKEITAPEGATVVPAPQFEALAKIVYGLYLKIFEHTTPFNSDGVGSDPLYICQRETSKLIQEGAATLRDGRDEVAAALGQRISEVGGGSYGRIMRDLEEVSGRFGLTRLFPPTIYYMVLAVYSSAERVYWTNTTPPTALVYLPGKITGVSGIEWPLPSIRTEGIPKGIALFWKWMAILFYQQAIHQTVPEGHTFLGDFDRMYLALAQAGRPLAVGEWHLSSQLGMPPKRTTANLAAAIYVGSLIDTGNGQNNDSRRQANLVVSRYMSNALMSTPCQWVDEDIAKVFVDSMVGAYEKTLSDKEYRQVEDQALGHHSYQAIARLMRQDFSKAGSDGHCGHSRFFAGLEATNDDTIKEPKGESALPVSADADLPLDDEGEVDPEAEDNPSGDDAEEESSDTEADPSEAPPDEDENNYMARSDSQVPPDKSTLIALASDGEGLDAFIYRSAVMRASEEMELRPELGISPKTAAALKDWCLRWLWLTSVEMTRDYVSSLGLDRIFKPLISEE